MKLQLVQENGIHILSVSEPVDVQGAQVIKAGVTKLYKNGHNRVVIELLNPREVSPHAFKMFGELHALARELAGDLVIVAAGLKHPQIPSFADRRAGLSHFKGAKTVASHPISAATAASTVVSSDPDIRPNMQAADLIALLEKRNALIKDLRIQLKDKTAGGIDTSVKESERLRRENEELRAKLDELIASIRIPKSVRSYDEKIVQLEAEIIRLSEQLSSDKSKPVF